MNNYYVYDNTQEIAGGDFNTKNFARSDLHWTDIIEVPLADIQTMKSVIPKGFTSSAVVGLKGKYRNGIYIPTNPTFNWGTPCPLNGGKDGGIPTNSADPKTYFYKGLGDADCIEYLYLLGIVS